MIMYKKQIVLRKSRIHYDFSKEETIIKRENNQKLEKPKAYI